MLNPLNIISKFIKSGNQKNLDKLKSTVKKVNAFENEVSKLSKEEFPKRTDMNLSKLKKIL